MFVRPLAAWFALIVMTGLVAGCARPGPSVLVPTDTVAPGAKLVTIYVATTRVRQPDSTNVYTNGRAPEMNYAEFTIAIPPRHKPGEIEWSDGVANPETDFVTVSQSLLTRAEFERKIAPRASSGKAGVFVHGYNVNFQEAVFRLAQMVGDSEVQGVPVLFAWPSDGSLTGYIADRDSAAYSRDGLAQVLTMMARDRPPGGVTVVAHSMGAWLTVETLRQLRLMKQNATLSRLDVVLASPDIDVDVFRSQMQAIGPLQPPITLLVSPQDGALRFSSRIAGERPRLGTLDVNDPRVQEGARLANVRVIDVSSVPSPDSFGHSRFANLASLYARLSRSERTAATAPAQAGAFVFNSVGRALATPFTLVGSALASP